MLSRKHDLCTMEFFHVFEKIPLCFLWSTFWKNPIKLPILTHLNYSPLSVTDISMVILTHWPKKVFKKFEKIPQIWPQFLKYDQMYLNIKQNCMSNFILELFFKLLGPSVHTSQLIKSHSSLVWYLDLCLEISHPNQKNLTP